MVVKVTMNSRHELYNIVRHNRSLYVITIVLVLLDMGDQTSYITPFLE